MAMATHRTPLQSTARSALKGLAWLALTGTLPAQAQLPAPPVSPAPVLNLEYDAQGNPKRSIQAPGVPGLALATQHTYDRLNRLRQTTDARAGTTRLDYNGREDLTQVTDPRGLVTQLPRNGLGDNTGLVSPDTGSATHTFDAAGNLKTRIDSRGVLATLSYDATNRLTSVVYSLAGQANQTVLWNYDQVGAGYPYGIGRLTSTQFGAGSQTYGYDAQGRLMRSTQTITTASATISKTLSYGYDGSGHLVSITYPSGRVLVIPHSGGLPVAMSLAKNATAAPVALISNLAFEASPGGAGPAQSWLWNLDGGATIQHQRVFDVWGRLVRHPLGGAIRDLAYDAAGRITSYTHWDATTGTATAAVVALNQAFGYDELGRLTSVATSPGTWTIGYDANGNRTAMTWAKAAAAPVTRVYGVAPTSNRLLGLSTPARTMGHDAAGNVLSDWQGFVGFAATYDLAGRLALMESSTNGSNYETTQYWYDAHGQRVLKYPTGATRCSGNPRSCVAQTVTKPTVYVYGPDGQLMGEYDGQTGAVRREYVWLQGAPVAFVDGTTSQNTTYYVQTDHLDTPRVVLDRQGRQRWSWVSEPFGTGAPATNPLGFGAVTLNLRMPGQYFDKESGLSQNWFRDYDAGVGRYVQSDPIGLQGGMNTYAYVGGNPLSFTDPMGLQPVPVPAPPLPPPPVWNPDRPTPTPPSLPDLTKPSPWLPTWNWNGITWPSWMESRSRGKSDPVTLPPVNPGRDCDGKCNPCPPGARWFVPRPGHGHENGYWHEIRYNQDQRTCMCYPDRPSRGLDGM